MRYFWTAPRTFKDTSRVTVVPSGSVTSALTIYNKIT